MAPARKQALTAVLPVQPGLAEPLALLLAASGAAVRAKLQAVESLHFARFALFGPPGAPTELLFETTFDDEAVAHLAELWEHAGPELSAVFAHCTGFRSPARFGDFERFLERRARPTAAFFTAHDALDVRRVRADAELRAGLAGFLDACDAELRPLSPLAVLSRAQTALAVDPAAVTAPRLRSPRGGAVPLRFADGARLALTWARAVVHDVADVLAELWHDTNHGLERAPGAPPSAVLGVQRCFSHVARVKPGRFRRAALRFALRTLDALTCGAAHGSHGDDAIHAARWLLLEDGRLVFLCNHDGSFAAALGAFASRASVLVSMIWSQTLGFPASFGWLFGGARDARRVAAFAAAGELSTPLWYSAYPELGAREVRDNAEIRSLFTGELDARRAERLLSLVRD